MKYLFIILGFSLLLTSQSFAAADCFNVRSVRTWKATSDFSATVYTHREAYNLDLSYCPELRWAHRIAFSSFSPSRVCSRDYLLVLDNFGNYVRQSCRIQRISRVQ